MIRDMDLLRKVVLAIEGCTDQIHSYALRVDGYDDQDEIAYHCLLLNDAGLISVSPGEPIGTNRSRKHKSLFIERLTMSGHDFRDQIKDDSKWQVATSIMKAAKQFTMDILLRNLHKMADSGWDHRMGQIASWVSANPLQ